MRHHLQEQDRLRLMRHMEEVLLQKEEERKMESKRGRNKAQNHQETRMALENHRGHPNKVTRKLKLNKPNI